jgi:UDP-N-acetylglucosamine:LPS N-acetylglucosamine transferase
MKTVDLVYFNAGGGHRAAALALEAVVAQQRRPWRVRLIDLPRVLDPERSLQRVTGFDAEAFYNGRLQRGWTLGLSHELKLLQGVIRMTHKAMLRPLQQHWARTEPDLVVSLVPNFNRVIYESVRSAVPGVPFATVLTDMADLPPHFWIEPDQDQTLVCGTVRAVEQARATGYGPTQVVLTSGMVLRPAFYGAATERRDDHRASMGLDPLRPTGIVMFGGQGSRQMLAIARALDDVQLVFLCGRNEALVRRLRTLRRRAPHVAFGFTEDVPAAMRLGDFFIGKPGPGCLSEAIHMGLPVITLRNAWTMPQERYNTEWVREQGVGLVVPSIAALGPAVAAMIGRLSEFHAATARIDNRAVFEVPEIMGDLMRWAPAVAERSRTSDRDPIALAA